MDHNPELRSALEAWIKAAEPTLIFIWAMPEDEIEILLNRLPGWGFHFWLLQHRDYDSANPESLGTLAALDETRVLYALINGDSRLSSILLRDPSRWRPLDDEQRRINWLVETYLSRFALGYVQSFWKEKSLGFYPDHFESIYRQLEVFLYAPSSIELSAMFVLRNLLPLARSMGEPKFEGFRTVQIDSGTVLRVASEAEQDFAIRHRSYWFGEYGSMSALTDFHFGAVVIEVRQTLNGLTDVHSDTERQSAFERATTVGHDVLDASRMLQPGPILIGTTRFQPSNVFLFGYEEASTSPTADLFAKERDATYRQLSGLGKSGDEESNEALNDYYWFPPVNIESLPEMVPKVRSVKTNAAVALAYRRLNDSWNRSRSDDALIDSWIGIEALFAQGSQTELRAPFKTG